MTEMVIVGGELEIHRSGKQSLTGQAEHRKDTIKPNVYHGRKKRTIQAGSRCVRDLARPRRDRAMWDARSKADAAARRKCTGGRLTGGARIQLALVHLHVPRATLHRLAVPHHKPHQPCSAHFEMLL